MGTPMSFCAARRGNHANKCGQKQRVRRPREGSLGGKERTRREGESRRQVEKEFKQEYVVVEKEIKKEYVAVKKHSMDRASKQKHHPDNLVPTRSPPTSRTSPPNVRPRPGPPPPKRGRRCCVISDIAMLQYCRSQHIDRHPRLGTNASWEQPLRKTNARSKHKSSGTCCAGRHH